VVPQHVGLGDRRERPRAARRGGRGARRDRAPLPRGTRDRRGRRPCRRGAGAPLLRQRDERRAAFGVTGRTRIRRTGSTTTSSRARRPSTRRGRARRPPSTTRSPSRRARRSSCGCGSVLPGGQARRGRTSPAWSPLGVPTRTRSTRS
jgi:hypothetical protein